MAVIYSPRGKPLTVTADDALWLARAVEAEGPPEREVAQALVNRWAWLYDLQGPTAWPTLAKLVRAYAQVVNPRWFEGGDLHDAYTRAHPEDARAEGERAWRREHVHSVRQDFGPSTRAAVAQALYGPITIAPGTVHFGRPKNGMNQLFTAREPSAWWALYSTEKGGPTVSSSSVLRAGKPSAAIAFVVLAGGGLFLALRGIKR